MTETTAIRPGIAAIVRDRSGRVLLHLRRVERAWAPISGRVEPGETLLQALHREIHEETALRCRSERLIGVYSDPGYQTVTYQDGRRFHFITAVFHVEAIGAAITGSAEGIEWGWFAPDDLPAPLTRYAEAWLLDALAPPSAPVVR